MGGVLELVNVPAEADFSNYELPITVTGVQNAENLRSWTVMVDGAKFPCKPIYRDGKVIMLYGGLCITVR